MKRSAKCKCLHCRELFVADFRNRGRQRHCGKPQCRKAAKALSQRLWLAKAENQNYFRGPENSARVREWRASHPGYWRRKKKLRDAMRYKNAAVHKILQIRRLRVRRRPTRYKNLSLTQPAVLVGLISTISGCALQEDIVRIARSFIARGQDILGMRPGAASIPSY